MLTSTQKFEFLKVPPQGPSPTVEAVETVEECLRTLRTYGIDVTEDVIKERARNIVTAIGHLLSR